MRAFVLIAVLAVSMPAEAADVMTLTCNGTHENKHDRVAASTGVVIDFTTRTVKATDITTAAFEITDINHSKIHFDATLDNRKKNGVFWVGGGEIDRTTGTMLVRIELSSEQYGRSSSSWELTCRQVQ